MIKWGEERKKDDGKVEIQRGWNEYVEDKKTDGK